jgi:site-specific recombinase XerD
MEIKRYAVPAICDKWLDYLKSERKSQNTIKSYSHDLKIIYTAIQDSKGLSEINVDILSQILVEDYRNVLYKENDSEKTINRRIKTLKSFYNWLSENDLIDGKIFNVVKRLKILKVPVREINVFTEEDLQNLIEASQLHNDKERNLLMIKILVNTGMRISELSNIELNHIKGNAIRIIGKGNKERTVYLSDSCIEALNNYLALRPQCNSKLLFLAKGNKPFTANYLSKKIAEWMEVGGLDRSKFHAHSCRTFCATNRLKVSSIDEVQELLGHSSIQTTKIYAKTSQEKLEQGRNLLNY